MNNTDGELFSQFLCGKNDKIIDVLALLTQHVSSSNRVLCRNVVCVH